jgi:Ca2+-binding RTX toxin-like protein
MSSFFDTLETRRLYAVDLICRGVSIDSYDANSGIIKYSIAVSNTGSTDDPPLGIGGIFLSTDLVVNNNDDIHLADIPASATPRTSQKLLQGSLQIPFTTKPGNYFLGAALDINNQVVELSEANNYAFSSNTINVPTAFNLTFDGTDKADTMIVNQPTPNLVSITINKSLKTYALDRIASLTLNGLSGNDTIRVLPTLALPVAINGGDGHDSIDGGGAGDTLYGGKGRDTIHGGGGRDIIHGGPDIDFLFGDSKGDRIWGDAGDDFIDGGSGDDRLDGGLGVDSIYGSGGNDIITARDNAADVIYGGPDSDKAELDPIDFRSGVEVVT